MSKLIFANLFIVKMIWRTGQKLAQKILCNDCTDLSYSTMPAAMAPSTTATTTAATTIK